MHATFVQLVLLNFSPKAPPEFPKLSIPPTHSRLSVCACWVAWLFEYAVDSDVQTLRDCDEKVWWHSPRTRFRRACVCRCKVLRNDLAIAAVPGRYWRASSTQWGLSLVHNALNSACLRLASVKDILSSAKSGVVNGMRMFSTSAVSIRITRWSKSMMSACSGRGNVESSAAALSPLIKTRHQTQEILRSLP